LKAKEIKHYTDACYKLVYDDLDKLWKRTLKPKVDTINNF